MFKNKESITKGFLIVGVIIMFIALNITVYDKRGFFNVLILDTIIISLVSSVLVFATDKAKRDMYDNVYNIAAVVTNTKTLVAILVSVMECIDKCENDEERVSKIFASMDIVDRILSYKDYHFPYKEHLKSKLNSLDLNSPNLRYELIDIINFLNTELIKMSVR